MFDSPASCYRQLSCSRALHLQALLPLCVLAVVHHAPTSLALTLVEGLSKPTV
jgi:hypothetical protein